MPWRTCTTCAVSGPSSRSSACRAIPGARCVRRAPGGRAARMNDLRRWTIVVVFAVAMAWMESAAVVYLRTLVGAVNPLATPLPLPQALQWTEVVREAATLVMLFAVG